MHLLYPIGLIALAGLLIPLIIHLWKLKQGKTLQIGSIALLGAGSPFTSRSYQITDWLLLLLRMLLIALLAFFLAEPWLLKKESSAGGQKGWVLLEKGDLPLLYKTQQKSIDSLLLAGYELHDFGLGFQKISLKDTINKNSGDKGPELSHFALLKELNGRLAPNLRVYLYADRRLQNQGGDLPRIDFRLIWKEMKRADTMNTWSSTFAHKTFEATSGPALTSFKRLDEGQDHSTLKDDSKTREESTIKVLIYGADHPEDVNYLRSAILAIAQETKRNVEVEVFNGKVISSLSFDIGFWISDKPVGSGFSESIRNGGRLFNYAGEEVSMLSSWLDVEPEGKGNTAGITLRKRTTAASYPGAQIWTDGFGIPLLTRTKEKSFDHYRFYSRINPGWTDLVWNAKFVEAMMPILLGNDGTDAGFGFEINPKDQRNSLVSLTQSSGAQSSAQPGVGQRAKEEASMAQTNALKSGKATEEQLPTASQKEEPLQKAFWLMAILVFTLERILSFRHKNKLNHG
ncbi:BatA domain-containing protein [Pedobacter sp. PLR]|uniref:BatA domain-containing protein n=1 Tax=Pedobacter sp. PLR TaxID=2994465 RepID=UPI002246A142|nr:BatA domain-containing protein [Pedobacter sp. PLR]MCX2454001.1 BatA domain-containing protein [Pedobacter sp. PLR]